MLVGLSRWIREGPAAALVPIRFRSPLERITVSRAYPRIASPLRWTLGAGTKATVLFGGDLALHRPVPAGDFDRIFGGLASLSKSSDGLFLNLETQLTSIEAPVGTIGSSMRADPSAIATLSFLGVTGVTCANNHSVDFGSEALSESARLVESAGIAVSGVVESGRDGGALVEVRGIRLGMLGYTDDWRVSENQPTVGRPGSHDPAVVRAGITAMRGRADLVVVQLHWGYEWSMYPLRSHRDLARSYVEEGASLVVCHHAHVPMGVEVWKGGAIAYGLGNLFFGRAKSPHHPFCDSAFLLRAGISRSGLTDLEVVPVTTDPDGRVGPAWGSHARLMGNALGYLSKRLGRDDYLSRVEDSRLTQEGRGVVLDLSRRLAAADRRGALERVRFLEPPRQRNLTARLRERGGTLGRAAELLEDLRDGRKDLANPAVAAEIASAGEIAARDASRRPQLGRIP